MDEELEIEETREGVERTRGIEEGEADHRIDEFRDIVHRLDDLRDQLRAHNDAVMSRLDSIAGIAVDNGIDETDAPEDAAPEAGDDSTDITERDWEELADDLDI